MKQTVLIPSSCIVTMDLVLQVTVVVIMVTLMVPTPTLMAPTLMAPTLKTLALKTLALRTLALKTLALRTLALRTLALKTLTLTTPATLMILETLMILIIPGIPMPLKGVLMGIKRANTSNPGRTLLRQLQPLRSVISATIQQKLPKPLYLLRMGNKFTCLCLPLMWPLPQVIIQMVLGFMRSMSH